MNAKEQQVFFGLVRKRYDKWNLEQVSGYVHGVVDSNRGEPQSEYLQRLRSTSPDHYAIGYLFGFVDGYGEDALTAKWNQDLRISVKTIEWNWWLDESTKTNSDLQG